MRVLSLKAAILFAIGFGCFSFTNAQFADPMIVGGRPADVLEYPYYVDMDGCGASLIAPGVVLSAAHCVDGGMSYVGQSVIVGGYDRQQVTNGAVRATVTDTLLHPSWNTWAGMSYDIMLLKLDSPVTTSGRASLNLNSQFSIPSAGQTLTIIGNGNTQEDGFQSDVLLEAEVLAVDTETCNEPYQGEVIDEVMFCAGDKGKDTCQGDSGGPIVVVDGSTHTQVGVVSWGYGCSRPGIPGVYARVSNVMSWIAHVTCTCWGVDDDDICSFLDSNDNFSCEDTGGGDRPGGDVGSGPSGCELIAGWTDEYGDGCGWFEAYDSSGCPETGFIAGTDGITAWEACCHCEGGGGGIGEPDGCLIIDGWVDSVGDSCGWYEASDSPGCPNFGSITGTNGASAWEACCHCTGGNFETPNDAPGCQLVSGWVDFAGDTCGWYEENDSAGCPLYGDFEGTNGVLAWDACCHCEGGGGGATDPGCELVSGWVDTAGDACRWYEDNDSVGCPNFGSISGTNGVVAWDACCHCEGGSPGGTNDDPGCELVSGWVDIAGDTCRWYEENDLQGCPSFGSISGTNGVVAWDACCHCEGGAPGGTNDDPGCELVSGWVDISGDTCRWYEVNDLQGCPNFGLISGTSGILARDACCHCEGGNPGGTNDDPGCELVAGWVDAAGDPCRWFEENDIQGCPTWGATSGTGGVLAWDACCHCEGGGPDDDSPGGGTNDDPGCELVAGWVDVSGDTCAWYEQYDTQGCPTYGAIGGTNGVLARDACCHCAGGNNPGCELVAGWVDVAGDACGWYEENDLEGCPSYGNTEGTNGVRAWQACCHCGGSRDIFDGCQLISGWLDEFGASCGHFEANDSPGCPAEGDVVGTGGATAREACCHCAGVGDDGFSIGDDGFNATPRPTPLPTPGPTTFPTLNPTPGPTPFPTPGPTPGPTVPAPTFAPITGPSPAPTPEPTPSPITTTSDPTESPSSSPSQKPASGSDTNPTLAPVVDDNPTLAPVIDVNPTLAPNTNPTLAPVIDVNPTLAPDASPTLAPVVDANPTLAPNTNPTLAPVVLDANPTLAPDVNPTLAPGIPNVEPTPAPVNPNNNNNNSTGDGLTGFKPAGDADAADRDASSSSSPPSSRWNLCVTMLSSFLLLIAATIQDVIRIV